MSYPYRRVKGQRAVTNWLVDCSTRFADGISFSFFFFLWPHVDAPLTAKAEKENNRVKLKKKSMWDL